MQGKTSVGLSGGKASRLQAVPADAQDVRWAKSGKIVSKWEQRKLACYAEREEFIQFGRSQREQFESSKRISIQYIQDAFKEVLEYFLGCIRVQTWMHLNTSAKVPQYIPKNIWVLRFEVFGNSPVSD